MAAEKPKPPKSQSAPSGGFEGYEMSFVRERERPELLHPQSQPAPQHRRGPWIWVVLAVALVLIALLLVLLV